jgi:hypothetical protein
MRLTRALIAGLAVILVVFVPVGVSFATPTSSLDRENGDVFDDWRVCRTRCSGEDGFFQEIDSDPYWPPDSFRPQIVFESLGKYADTACRLGEEFAEEYSDKSQRAEKIFYFVRDNVRYQLDEDQFDLEEFAQNADELADTIEGNGQAFGDCEDMAILLSVMFFAGGLRSAVVSCPGHAGVVVYLPDYEQANVVLELDGESGWVWAEATGKNNSFGWFPEGQLDGPFLAYEVSNESIDSSRPTAIAANPSEFSFNFVLGGQNPASQTLAIENSGQGTMAWSVADDATWLSATPASGICSGETCHVTLSAEVSGLAAGTYQADLTISSADATNSPLTIPVYLNVAATAAAMPTIALTPSDFSFRGSLGGSNPASQNLTITLSGQGAMQWSVSDDAAWLAASPSSGVSTGGRAEVALSVDLSKAGAGSHDCTVTVSSPGASNSPQTMPVHLKVSTSRPSMLLWVLVFFIVVVLMFAIIMVGKLRRRS